MPSLKTVGEHSRKENKKVIISVSLTPTSFRSKTFKYLANKIPVFASLDPLSYALFHA